MDRTQDSTLAGPSALARVLGKLGGIDVVDQLTSLSGSDFGTVMLEVSRRRAANQTAASILRRYQRDRFVVPASTSWQALRRAEDLLIAQLAPEFYVLALAPLVPLGTHSVLGTVSQDKVITATRACEVTADATNALALEAAVRRLHSRDLGLDRDDAVRLAAVQRVVRAQRFEAGWSAHFTLFAMVTAGRDQGGHRFQRTAVCEQVWCAAAGLAAAGLAGIQVAVTARSEAGEKIAAGVTADLGSGALTVVADQDRQSGRGYYRDRCFKINAVADGEPQEFGDGGFTDWSARLTTSAKERLLISGIGVDRVAAVLEPPDRTAAS